MIMDKFNRGIPFLGHISDQIYGNSYNFIYAYTHTHASIHRATSCSRFGVCFISRQGWILQTPRLHLIMYTVTYCDPVLAWVVPNSWLAPSIVLYLLYLQSPPFWPVINIISCKKPLKPRGPFRSAEVYQVEKLRLWFGLQFSLQGRNCWNFLVWLRIFEVPLFLNHIGDTKLEELESNSRFKIQLSRQDIPNSVGGVGG